MYGQLGEVPYNGVGLIHETLSIAGLGTSYPAPAAANTLEAGRGD